MLRHISTSRTRKPLASSRYRYPCSTRRPAPLRQESTSASASTGTTQIPRNSSARTRLLLLLGIGATSALAIQSFPSSTIHADAKRNSQPFTVIERKDVGKKQQYSPSTFDAIVEADGDAHIESNPSTGIRRRDSFQIGSNFPIEDVITNAEWSFSPTLTFSCTTILDGHNGARLADFLGQVLPVAVLGSIADVYSKYGKEEDRTGFDLSGGREFAFDPERNPGESPDPAPPGEEIDQAIREAFLALDEFVVHESAKSVLGLSKAAYAALCASKDEEGNEAKEKEERDSAPVTTANTKTSTKSRANALEALSFSYSGSCVLMGLFNHQDRSLRIALTGDSRAVYGRRVSAPKESGKSYIYEVEHLSADQNASNPSEAARLTSLHPDEPDLLKSKRVLGWGPSRAFGDGAMKWCREVQNRLHEEFFGDRPRENLKTPPYFTAEPVITLKEGVERGDFVVYASDGLWDCLESEEVVGLVGMWLEERGVRERVKVPGPGPRGGIKEVLLPSAVQSTSNQDDDGGGDDDEMDSPTPVKLHVAQSHSRKSSPQKVYAPSELPVLYPTEYKDKTPMYKYWRAEKKFVCEDESAAAHLARNALGGVDRDLRDALTAMDVPRSRRFRDDISVVVVFFD